MQEQNKLLNFYQKQKSIKELKQLLPEIFTQEKLDVQKLKRYLGSEAIIDEGNYALSWFGKEESIARNARSQSGELVLDRDKSIRLNKTQNKFIEGDNLDALHLLQDEYSEKIRFIYIDPPYNTGKSFSYKDRYKISSNTYNDYLENSNIGRVSTALKNQIESGEIHTNWLNMIYPRLVLSRNLLEESGTIAISIDEIEKANLQLICNEVFGEENFLGCFIWVNRTSSNDTSNLFANNHEYILIYAKNRKTIKLLGEPKDLSNYTNPDNDINGAWIADNPTAASGNENSRFSIINPYTSEEYLPPPGRYWAFAESRVREWTNSGKMVFPKQKGNRFLLKKYRDELKSEYKPVSSIITNIPTSKGTKELKDLYPNGSPFKYPKPTDLLCKLLVQFTKPEDTILDLFSGSASLAHAVMKVDDKEMSKRNFICLQNDEPITKESDAYSMGFERMCDLSYDRIVKAGKLYSAENIGLNYYKIENEQ